MGMGHEITARAQNLHTVFPHGSQVLVAGDQMDLRPTSVQCGAPVGADGSGTDYCNSHGDSLECAYCMNSHVRRPRSTRISELVAYSMRSHLPWQWSPPGRSRRRRTELSTRPQPGRGNMTLIGVPRETVAGERRVA